MLYVHMAAMTEDERFPPACGHDLNPLRLLAACVFLQVFERPDVMNLYFVRHAGYFALFAHLGQ